MMPTPLSILMVEDNESDALILARLLKKADFDLAYERVETAEQMRAALAKREWDMVISDYKLPQFNGYKALQVLQSFEIDIPFIVISGTISEEMALEMMMAGAQDYLIKGEMVRLIPAIKRELKQSAIRRENKRAENALRESEKQYRDLINLLPSGVVVHREGKILLANDAGAKLFGAENPQRLIGTALMERVHPDYRKIVIERVKQSQSENGSAPLLEEKLLRLDNTVFDAEVAAQHIIYADKPAMLAVFNDISERKKSEEELRNRLMELEAVHTISKSLRLTQQIEEALPLLLDQTLAALSADSGAIWLHDLARGELRIAVARGWLRDINEPPLNPHQGIVGKVFTTGNTHVTKDFATDPEAYMPDGVTIPTGWAGACLPIVSADKRVGILFVSVAAPREIEPEQIKLLSSLTEMTGATLYRMRLYEETAQRLRNVQALHEIDQAITSSLDLSIIFDILLNHVTAQLNADAAAIVLFHSYQNTLEYAATRGFRAKPKQRLFLNNSLAGKIVMERHAIQWLDFQDAQEEGALKTLWTGEGFNAYVGAPLIVKGEIKGVLEVFHRKALDPSPEWLDFLNTLAGQAAIAIADTQLFNNLQRANQELTIAYDATIEGWSRALDLRDKETEGHTLRVTEMSTQLAMAMGVKGNDLLNFRRGAMLHDIGKMGVRDNILLKAGALTEQEKIAMQQHAQFAYDMLFPIKYLRPALEIPYCHHEKWDGTGYPRGLQGEQIPLAARIFAVADVWDAVTSDRPYRKAWSEEKAAAYIREQSGSHFDPHIVEKFIEVFGVQ